jgi:hypothetical protein
MERFMLYLASFAANDISIIKIMYVYGTIVWNLLLQAWTNVIGLGEHCYLARSIGVRIGWHFVFLLQITKPIKGIG